MLLKEMVEKDLCFFTKSFNNWQDAMYGVAKPLLEKGILENRYIERIIDNVKQFGPYFIIAPEVAMPHSSIDTAGVNDTAISFCKVDEPVKFDENDVTKNARVFFVLAATDEEKHLKNMTKLCELLLIEGIVDDLLKAKNVDDLLLIDKKYSVKKEQR